MILFSRIFHIEMKSMLIILFNICDAGKQVGGIQLDSSTFILLFSYIVIYDVLYNLLWIMGVEMILILVIRYFKYHKRPWDVKRIISMYIEKKGFYKINRFYKRKYFESK